VHELDTLGKHVVVELSRCQNIEYYDNEKNLQNLLLETVDIAKATLLNIHISKFQPVGITATVHLAESHISCHLFTEEKYVSFDIYTCSSDNSIYEAQKHFVQALGAQLVNNLYITRGIVQVDGGRHMESFME